MKGSIKSHKSAIAVLLALALSGQSSWAAQNSAAVQGNDFLSSIQQIEVKQIDFPAPTHRQQTPSASRAQINDLQQEIARLKKQLKAAEQEKKSLSAPGDLQAQNTQLLKDNSALAKRTIASPAACKTRSANKVLPARNRPRALKRWSRKPRSFRRRLPAKPKNWRNSKNQATARRRAKAHCKNRLRVLKQKKPPSQSVIRKTPRVLTTICRHCAMNLISVLMNW
ncbi:hypothetical protein [Cronobacter sakazakii]|uniref:hypothetical protein n=1 Tax=Cronobacter sakazakii TaxID=28141 RepID=UPI00131A4044|nr:hypothetical protein [Cronobacter sakazakii]